MMKYLFIFLIFLRPVSILTAQHTDTAGVGQTNFSDSLYLDTTLKIESTFSPYGQENDREELTKPVTAFFPDNEMDSIRAKNEYGYMKNLDSLLRNLKVEATNDPGENAAPNSIFDIGVVKIFIWLIAISAVLYLLYQLFAGQQNLFYKNKKLETDEGLLEVDKTSVSPLLMSQQAAARGDYRQAVRYQYLYILHLMGEKRMVNLQPQKTNYQYLQEVKQKPFAGEFGTLTLQFEYVWYGEFNLNLAQYDAIAGGYRKFIASWL